MVVGSAAPQLCRRQQPKPKTLSWSASSLERDFSAGRAYRGIRQANLPTGRVYRGIRQANLPTEPPFKQNVNDPSAGSPTDTLLRLLLPLSGRARRSFLTTSRDSQGTDDSADESEGLARSFNR